ncbi:hypothetical protein JCM10207_005778 [Rhodosporidiobolus poonsookiae]
MASFPLPPDGANPYAYYRTYLHDHAIFRPSDPAGFKARLIVLFVILAILFITSVVNTVMHIWGYRMRGRKLWFFRLVERDGGKHIISNHFILCGAAGIVLWIVLFGETMLAWRVWISPAEPTEIHQLSKWAFAVWPMAYAVGWCLSWACFQAYLQVEGSSRALLNPNKTRGRFHWATSMPAWVENVLFIGGGIGAVAILASLAGVGSDAADDQWAHYDRLDTSLANSAAAWDGTALSAAEAARLLRMLRYIEKASARFYHTTSNLCIGAAVLPLFLVIINLLMFGFLLLIRRQIQFQLAHLPSFTEITFPRLPADDAILSTTEQSDAKDGADEVKQPGSPPLSNVFESVFTFVPLDTFSPSPSPASPTAPASPASPSRRSSIAILAPAPSSSPFSPVLSPLSPLSPPASTLVGSSPPTSPSRAPRPKPTRAQVREIAEDPQAAEVGGMAAVESQMAERILALVKAENELILIGASVLLTSLLFTITALWSIPTLRSVSTLTFPKIEAFLTLPLWICGIGVAFAECTHAVIEWRWALGREWRARGRRERARRASESAEAALSAGGGGASAAGGESGVGKGSRRPSFVLPGPLRSGTSTPLGRQSRKGSLVSRGLGLGLGSRHEHAYSGGGGGALGPTVTDPGRIEVAVEVTQTEERMKDGDEIEEGEGDYSAEEGSVVGHRRQHSHGSAVKRKEAWED